MCRLSYLKSSSTVRKIFHIDFAELLSTVLSVDLAIDSQYLTSSSKLTMSFYVNQVKHNY